jgi:hypothetical protein
MKKLVLAALASLAAFCAHAQLSIEITGAGANRIPIAIAPFAGEASAARTSFFMRPIIFQSLGRNVSLSSRSNSPGLSGFGNGEDFRIARCTASS